jgi:hypothetical protein
MSSRPTDDASALSAEMIAFTMPFNVAQLSVISIACGFAEYCRLALAKCNQAVWTGKFARAHGANLLGCLPAILFARAIWLGTSGPR